MISFTTQSTVLTHTCFSLNSRIRRQWFHVFSFSLYPTTTFSALTLNLGDGRTFASKAVTMSSLDLICAFSSRAHPINFIRSSSHDLLVVRIGNEGRLKNLVAFVTNLLVLLRRWDALQHIEVSSYPHCLHIMCVESGLLSSTAQDKSLRRQWSFDPGP